jgi:hypothetical protein
MQFLEEPENEAFEFFLERELDFSTYETKNKYEFDFEMVTGYDKPKLNRNNIQFNFDNDINDLLDGEDSNNSEQQDGEPISERDDYGLYLADTSDRGEEEAQSPHSSD